MVKSPRNVTLVTRPTDVKESTCDVWSPTDATLVTEPKRDVWSPKRDTSD